MADDKDPAAVALGKRRFPVAADGKKNAEAVKVGRRGGLAAARAMTAEQRAKRARKAGSAPKGRRRPKEGG